MAENINIDFMPNRKTADTQRVGAVEDYLKLFTDRAKFCFSSIYDELSDIGKRLDGLDDFTISTPSSVDLVVENAVILQEKESQQVIHNFTETNYVKGNKIGYGGVGNSIILGGYVATAEIMTGNTEHLYGKIKFPKGKMRTSSGYYSTIYENLEFYPIIKGVYPTHVTYTHGFSSNGEQMYDSITHAQFPVNSGFGYGMRMTGGINPPDDDFEYGSAEVTIYGTYKGDTYASQAFTFLLPFSSEAEFNAAVGLTNTPIELIELKDFQYLVPESQIIVDKELSEGSDNVIANSTVAKALSLKADKETVETLSLVVESKADVIELEALSEDYNTAKADFDTRIRKLATASANHGIILNEHADMLELKADKTEVQLISQELEGKAELSDLNFIGENMLENATFHSNFAKWHFTNNNFSEITVKDGFPCAHFSGGIGKSTSVRQSVLDEIDKENLDQLYTFSADIRFDDYIAGTTNPFAQLYFSATYDNNGTSSAFNATTVAGSPELSQYSGQGWKKVYWTVRFARVPNSIYAFVYARDFTGELYFKNLKLEKGSVPTAYTPSVTDYTELVDRVAVLEAMLIAENN